VVSELQVTTQHSTKQMATQT